MEKHTGITPQQTEPMRLPGEFERQSALLVAWPHAGTDWAEVLPAIRAEFQILVEATLDHQRVILLVDPDDRDPLPPSMVHHPKCHIVQIPFDDTWCRDFGPITLSNATTLALLDFRFTAWGKPYQNTEDDHVVARLCQLPGLTHWIGAYTRQPIDFVLEGGAIESNGLGSVLINWYCLETRHPNMTRNEITEALKKYLCVDQVLGIDIKPHPGDDTDGHIDTLARFINPTTLVAQGLHDADTHHALLSQLSEIRPVIQDGSAVEPTLIILPPTSRKTDLPMNYVNFTLINDACLVPTYNMDSDTEALAVLTEAMPDRKIIGIPSTTLISQFGGPHCSTMQIPEVSSRPPH